MHEVADSAALQTWPQDSSKWRLIECANLPSSISTFGLLIFMLIIYRMGLNFQHWSYVSCTHEKSSNAIRWLKCCNQNPGPNEHADCTQRTTKGWGEKYGTTMTLYARYSSSEQGAYSVRTQYAVGIPSFKSFPFVASIHDQDLNNRSTENGTS